MFQIDNNVLKNSDDSWLEQSTLKVSFWDFLMNNSSSSYNTMISFEDVDFLVQNPSDFECKRNSITELTLCLISGK